jgi:hypothetical protein
MRLLSFLASVTIAFVVPSSYATSFGHVESGKIISMAGNPAICLPESFKGAFPVGWFVISNSHSKNIASWAYSLRSGEKPLELKGGECIVYKNPPLGYESTGGARGKQFFQLQENNTYVFRVSGADFPHDTYRGIFCVRKNINGSLSYLQYIYAADGREITPSCDAKLNGNAE